MKKKALVSEIQSKHSYLCVGLDTDPQQIPPQLKNERDPVFTFNKAIIDATQAYSVAYKLNIAFYESLGPRGWESLEKTLDYMPDDCMTIADAKRGDIGNTAAKYAQTFFDNYNFDAVTLNPLMGKDSIEPFLEYKNKWVILLGLTSNHGAEDFQLQRVGDQYLYELILKKGQNWASPDHGMFVIGATRPEKFQEIRGLCPHHFFLVPGIGKQGGSIETISKAGMTNDVGLLVNVSRSLIYAGQGHNFQEAVGKKAWEYALLMKPFVEKANQNMELHE